MTRLASCCRLLALVLVWQAVHAADPPPVHPYQLSYFQIGPDSPERPLSLANLQDRLDARPECSATLRRLKYGDLWYKVPAGVDPAQHVSVVLAMFGKRLDIMAFQWNGPGGAVSLAACRPALEAANPRKYSYINTITPGPDSVDYLALIELASAIAQESAKPAVERPLTRVAVSIRKAADAPVELTLDDGPAEAPQAVTEEQVKAIQALALVAAWDNGLQPTLAADAPNTLTLQVGRVVQGYAFTVTWQAAGGKPFVVQQFKLEETLLYPGLDALVARALAASDRVVDLVQLDQEAVEPLALVGHELVYAIHEHSPLDLLRASSIDSMLVKWKVDTPVRGTMRFTTGIDAAGVRQAFQYDPSVIPVNALTGAVTRTAWPEANFPWSFQMIAEDTVLVAKGRELIRQQGYKRTWTFNAVAPLQAGPALAEGLALAGSEAGVVHAVDLAEGAERWQTSLGGRLLGPLAVAGDRVLAASEEGTLSCLELATGKLVWQAELGDTLAAPPWLFATGVVAVASGTGDLRVLALADGKEQARAVVPNFVSAVTPLPVEGKPALATVDAGGTVRLYALPSLELHDTIPLHFRPGWPPLFVPRAPINWGRGEGLFDEEPLLLVPDFAGNLFILKATL